MSFTDGGRRLRRPGGGPRALPKSRTTSRQTAPRRQGPAAAGEGAGEEPESRHQRNAGRPVACRWMLGNPSMRVLRPTREERTPRPRPPLPLTDDAWRLGKTEKNGTVPPGRGFPASSSLIGCCGRAPAPVLSPDWRSRSGTFQTVCEVVSFWLWCVKVLSVPQKIWTGS